MIPAADSPIAPKTVKMTAKANVEIAGQFDPVSAIFVSSGAPK